MEQRARDQIDVRVHVVGDDDGFRTAMTRLLNASGLQAVTYRCAGEFLSAHDGETAGCVVLDLAGLELMHKLAETVRRLPVIFLSGHSDVDTTVHALKAGAADVLVKPVVKERLLDAVKKAISSDIDRRASCAELASLVEGRQSLSPRERAVMDGVVAGKLNKQLAVELGTCERTIKAQRARMMRKLRLHSLAALVRAAKLLDG